MDCQKSFILLRDVINISIVDFSIFTMKKLCSENIKFHKKIFKNFYITITIFFALPFLSFCLDLLLLFLLLFSTNLLLTINFYFLLIRFISHSLSIRFHYACSSLYLRNEKILTSLYVRTDNVLVSFSFVSFF